jgi:hypothetical protein
MTPRSNFKEPPTIVILQISSISPGIALPHSFARSGAARGFGASLTHHQPHARPDSRRGGTD